MRGLFADMVLRHNTFKDAKMDMRALDGFDERIYLVLGIACLLMGVLLLVDHIRREREEKAKKQDAADADKE